MENNFTWTLSFNWKLPNKPLPFGNHMPIQGSYFRYPGVNTLGIRVGFAFHKTRTNMVFGQNSSFVLL
jgi:hypothetical protein